MLLSESVSKIPIQEFQTVFRVHLALFIIHLSQTNFQLSEKVFGIPN